MGLFDIFSSKKKASGSAPPPSDKVDKNIARLGKTASDKLAQNYDRMEAIEVLARMHTGDAAAALLRRFSFHIDPSITDQEEKELAYQGIVAAGKDAVEPIVSYCAKAESVSWPLKMLRELLSPEELVEEVVDLLEGFGTEYTRNIDPKVQLLLALENQKGERVVETVERFLEDTSEPVRFQAVATLVSTGEEAIAEPLIQLTFEEESVRICNRIAEGFSFRGWVVPAAHRDKFARAIREGGFSIDVEGKVRSRLGRAAFVAALWTKRNDPSC